MPGGDYARWSGTSMAAPPVSGQAALVQALAPRLNVDQRIKKITASARTILITSARYGTADIVASLQQAR